MARIIPGPLVTDIRNKLGSQVFSRNQHGNYVGALVPITQTPSARKNQIYAAGAAVATAWHTTLTDAQRNQWDEAAKVQARSARTLGRDPLSGQQFHARVNLTLELAGATQLTEPPTTSDVTPLTSLSLASDADAQSLLLTFTPATVPTGHILQVWATPNCSPGKLRLGNRSCWLCDLPAGTTSPASIAAPWLAKPWPSAVVGTLATQTIQPGEKIFAHAKFINLTNAARSGSQLASAIATGTGDSMLTRTTHIDSPAILTLKASPVELVPAPAANKYILPLALFAKYTPGTTPFTLNTTPTTLTVCLGAQNYICGGYDAGANLGLDALFPIGVFLNTNDDMAQGIPPADMSAQPLNLTVNTAQELTNGDGTLDITVCYAVI